MRGHIPAPPPQTGTIPTWTILAAGAALLAAAAVWQLCASRGWPFGVRVRFWRQLRHLRIEDEDLKTSRR